MKKWLLCVTIGALVWPVVGSTSEANSEDREFILEDFQMNQNSSLLENHLLYMLLPLIENMRLVKT